MPEEVGINDDLTLRITGKAKCFELSGWQEIRVSVGIERCPSDFEIAFTERYPGNSDEIIVHPGDECQVLLGGDLVLTGYVDRYMPSIESNSHTIRITGRSKCQDLVDCAAVWSGSQISGTNAYDVAKKLAEVYGISVSCDVKDLVPIPQCNVMLGETAFEVIDRLCRYSALLAYDGPDGNLILSRVGIERMAGGVTEGENMERGMMTHSMDQRFSEYQVFLLSCATYGDLGDGGNLKARVQDENMPRTRYRYMIAESGEGSAQDIAMRRAQWEANRRFGRGYMLRVTVDSWRDSAGALWRQNKLVPVKVPTLMKSITQTAKPTEKGETISDWVISEVSYTRDGNGTHAELTIMPAIAFEPEPLYLLPGMSDVPGDQE